MCKLLANYKQGYPRGEKGRVSERSVTGTSQVPKKCFSSASPPLSTPLGAVVCRTGSCPHQPAHAGQAWTLGPAGRGCRGGILGQGQGPREGASVLPRHLTSSDGWDRGPGSLREAQHLGPRDQEANPEAESQGGGGLLIGGGVHIGVNLSC